MMPRQQNRLIQKKRASTASLPAPVGGWNARDALGAMPPKDAAQLTNWWPATSSVYLRYGYSKHATGLDGQCETLLTYNGLTTDKLFGATDNGSIYDVTSAGAVGAAVVSALTNGRLQYSQITTAGGSFLMAVNGANKMQYYDGSVWTVDGGTYTITGVDTADCININLFKNRIWFIEQNTMNAWYLPTGAIQGAAVAFPLGGVAALGGSLIYMATWTIDAGYGVDDLAVFITTKGEIIVYRGTDPSSASTFALVGVWQVGTPVGVRCCLKYGADLLVITQDGVMPMSAGLQSSRLDPRVSLTDKIQFAVSRAVSIYSGNFGWQLLYFPKENQLYLNVPFSEGQDQQQFVMNTITKNWCNFEGWAANCWALFSDNPYFGGNTYVGLAWDGYDDDGADIEGTAIQAFSNFGNETVQKRFTMMRPVFFSNGIPSVLGEINVDFDLSDSTAPLSLLPSVTYGVWGTGLWDIAVWGADTSLLQNWQGVTGIGYYGAPFIKVAAQGITVQWVNTTVVWETGGIL